MGIVYTNQQIRGGRLKKNLPTGSMWLIAMVNVGRHTSPMDPMGYVFKGGQSL